MILELPQMRNRDTFGISGVLLLRLQSLPSCCTDKETDLQNLLLYRLLVPHNRLIIRDCLAFCRSHRLWDRRDHLGGDDHERPPESAGSFSDNLRLLLPDGRHIEGDAHPEWLTPNLGMSFLVF